MIRGEVMTSLLRLDKYGRRIRESIQGQQNFDQNHVYTCKHACKHDFDQRLTLGQVQSRFSKMSHLVDMWLVPAPHNPVGCCPDYRTGRDMSRQLTRRIPRVATASLTGAGSVVHH